ncbi:OLC1v1021723C2 [Oldenlandia corymbosa var. corymbosa]|uniref:OLC1v1021723C2 n=1 Tax=Oldenlandia corymbosa var. corymbosa TaxID=529605 RepID=A0AAV1BW99_OLDCO|nr:OLC1v1021723C2 [Oldenlandia corymbosa var. corymbosa]
MAANTMPALSSLELMLKQLQKNEDDQPEDVPPALPSRPVIRARLPRSRNRPPFTSSSNICEDYGRKKGRLCVSIESDYHLGSSAFLADSANGSTEGFESKNNEDGAAEKTGIFDCGKEGRLEQIPGSHRDPNVEQMCLCDHDLDRGVITLQSFVRGENARKHFAKKMTAIAVIQKRVKGHLRSRLLEEEDPAIKYLQSSVRAWLAWRHLNSIDQREKLLTWDARTMKNLEKKDQVEVPYSVLVDLQRRVLKTEALLDQKKEENASLRLQIKQLERKRQQHEAKMKSMEKTWQDQLTSMQETLAGAATKRNPKSSAGKLGMLFALPEDHDEDDDDDDSPLTIRARLNSNQIIDHERAMSDENAGILIRDELEQQAACSANQEEELQKLKLKFKTWKKDFKTKLVVAKTTIKKLGNSDGGRTSGHKKWWAR